MARPDCPTNCAILLQDHHTTGPRYRCLTCGTIWGPQMAGFLQVEPGVYVTTTNTTSVTLPAN